MKKYVTYFLATLILSSLFVVPIYAKKAETGNGAQSGKHFTLNILGKKNWDKGEEKSVSDDEMVLKKAVLTGINWRVILWKFCGRQG